MSDGPRARGDNLEKTEELYRFLQGVVPAGYSGLEGLMPALSEDQAWTVIWYLGNNCWQVTDYIERCESCGGLYNSEAEGWPGDEQGGAHRCDECPPTEAHQESE